jgi:hypothetical protein
LALAGGIAYATIPDANKVFTACMLKGVGTIRLVDKSLPSTNLMSRCTDKETEISWNQAGQPGAVGPQGLKGEAGAPGTNGTDGTPGADGKDGANGTPGTDGKDGVSVTSAVEPAGANCADGGSKFTAANGVTYACNGAPGSGVGPTGQDATTVDGTGALIEPFAGPAIVPGLSQSISVPSDSVVYVATNGGVQTNSTSATDFSAVDVFVSIDGQPPSHGLRRRIVCANSAAVVGMLCDWSLSAAFPLGQGSHTIEVRASGFPPLPGKAPAIVGGGVGSLNQGALTVMVLKK